MEVMRTGMHWLVEALLQFQLVRWFINFYTRLTNQRTETSTTSDDEHDNDNENSDEHVSADVEHEHEPAPASELTAKANANATATAIETTTDMSLIGAAVAGDGVVAAAAAAAADNAATIRIDTNHNHTIEPVISSLISNGTAAAAVPYAAVKPPQPTETFVHTQSNVAPSVRQVTPTAMQQQRQQHNGDVTATPPPPPAPALHSVALEKAVHAPVAHVIEAAMAAKPIQTPVTTSTPIPTPSPPQTQPQPILMPVNIEDNIEPLILKTNNVVIAAVDVAAPAAAASSASSSTPAMLVAHNQSSASDSASAEPALETMGNKTSKKRKFEAGRAATGATVAEDMSNAIEALSIPICEGTHAENVLYRLKRGATLRVHPDAALLGREIILHTNYPAEGKKFVRTESRVLEWHLRNGKQITTAKHPHAHVVDTDIYAEVQLNVSGTFRFWFHFKESRSDSEPNGALYVQVEPILHVGPPGAQKIIPLNSVRCQTVISKLLGPLGTWEAKLRVAKESGYNVIHFTPIQHLGGSQSAYSLRDQLSVNPHFAPAKGKKVTFDDVEKIVRKCRQEWGMASICDIVLNHTANESDWVREHPDATYSCATCPYLRPAYLLDAMFTKVGDDIADGLLEHVGVPVVIEHECHLEALRHQLHTTYLPQIHLHELYQCDALKYVNEFTAQVRSRQPPKNVANEVRFDEVQLIADREYRRLGATINLELALEIFNGFHGDCFDEDQRVRKCAETLRHHLDCLNGRVYDEVHGYLSYAIDNCLAGVRYERVQADGPRVREISEKYAVFMKYFTQTAALGKTLAEVEQGMYGEMGRFCMAHNGWVMGYSDPLRDFADEQPGRGNVYLKRELIAWGDSVKLRFGRTPEDSPYLWRHMTEYVETTARIFDGVRLDNCHSTPLHVAEYLLDAARKINPDLYVVAELFTNSDATDNVFVNRLGITSLIREALSAWDSHEEGRLVYRYGGVPVGAFNENPKRDVASSIAHALFLDMTHDNPSPVDKRSAYDLLPSAALVSMACCATGSNRGYDELVPHHIHVVDEARQYQEWGKGVEFNSGIVAAKRALNLLHGQLAEEGFSQVYVDQMDPNIVAVTRHSPLTHQSVILVAHTAFGYPHPNAGPTGVRPLRFEGCLDEIILEAGLCMKSDKPYDRPGPFKKDANYINGFGQFELSLREHIPLSKSQIFRTQAHIDGNNTQLDFEQLYPGSVVAVRVSLHPGVRSSFDRLKMLVNSLLSESGADYEQLLQVVGQLSLVDLNAALFTCDQEERDQGWGGAAYDIPNYGAIVYCGLQGFISILDEISPRNDLGHPLCNNLREGNWMLDYISGRLAHYAGTRALSDWYKSAFEPLKIMPRYLIPCYFDTILSAVYNVLVQRVYQLMPEFIRNGHNFPQSLALATLQFLAVSKWANLPALSPAIKPPKAPQQCVTLSAGLPHFSTGYMRCWGRDTFIALRGLLFISGRFNEARYIILGFAQCMRHGLIPNLLDNGTKPRFNCRDAVWWWLHSIKQYVTEAPRGAEILTDKVSRIFPYDDDAPHAAGAFDQELIEVMQETLRVHFQGLQYRERNAGHEIDAHMTDKGFNNQIGVHPESGFVFGGNIANCGTWMDKMGSSEKAGNRGRPSTPRDGSAVELVGLQMAVLRFMQELSEKGIISYKSVERKGPNGEVTAWTYKEWADRIKNNFERFFFVNEMDIAPSANKKNIYKDTFGATQTWTDFQLRCNFPITMVVAPELFTPENAWRALEQAREHLLGPLGMKTLDPDDWNYRGNYDNSNDSEDCTVAHGANYHNGPEWVWPIGFYLRARLIFAKKCGFLSETIAETWSILRAHLRELQTSHWRGLPELTNDNGSYCRDSCRTQAWSIATVMEVLNDLHALGGDV